MSGEVDSFQTTALSTRHRSNVPSLAENLCVTFTVSVLKVAGFVFLDVTDVRHWRCEEGHHGQELRMFTANRQTDRQTEIQRQTDTVEMRTETDTILLLLKNYRPSLYT